jgi:hypothetical protein
MLRFAKSLLSSDKPNKESREAKSLTCDFFILEGERWISLSDGKCIIEFDNGGKGGPAMIISCEAESVSESFNVDSISHLVRFSDEEDNPCFQWISRKGKSGDNLDEYGIRFDSESDANLFATLIVERSQQTATVVFELDSGVNMMERSPAGKWEVIAKDVGVMISKTKKGDEFLSVRSKKEGPPLFHSFISASLQLSWDDDLGILSFLGLTPLTEDLRVLGVEISDRPSASELLAALKLTVKPAPRVAFEQFSSESESEESDVEMWEDTQEHVSAPVRSRKMRATKQDRMVRNKFLETGRKDDSNAFVFSLTSDKKVGYQVYTSSSPGELHAVSSVSKITGKELRDPSALMLHEGDTKCLLLDPSLGRDKVFELDLARGQVVSEWTPSTGSITALLPLSRESQKSAEKIFLGINDRSIFAIDPRMQPKEHVGNRAYSFTYASNVKLSSAATDRSGHIVAANRTGELRLFDGQTNRDGDLKKAKTLLAGLGDPITHVDVSSSGEYILSTTATYLTLTRTVGADNVTSGFAKSISSSATEGPMVLSLMPQDIAKYGLKSISFTPARFDEKRNVIVTSTGSLAILFDMKRLPSYSVKPMSDFIVDIERAGTGVVAMYEDRVELAKTARGHPKQ